MCVIPPKEELHSSPFPRKRQHQTPILNTQLYQKSTQLHFVGLFLRIHKRTNERNSRVCDKTSHFQDWGLLQDNSCEVVNIKNRLACMNVEMQFRSLICYEISTNERMFILFIPRISTGNFNGADRHWIVLKGTEMHWKYWKWLESTIFNAFNAFYCISIPFSNFEYILMLFNVRQCLWNFQCWCAPSFILTALLIIWACI